MNFSIIKGRLTASPEGKTTNSGKDVCTISVAVDRDYTEKDGKRQADFFNVVCWGSLCKFVVNYFVKGQEILVQGKMESRTYKDREGNDRRVWELIASKIEFCGSKMNRGDNSSEKNESVAPPPSASASAEDYPF